MKNMKYVKLSTFRTKFNLFTKFLILIDLMSKFILVISIASDNLKTVFILVNDY